MSRLAALTSRVTTPPAKPVSPADAGRRSPATRGSIAIFYAFQQLYGTEIVLQRLAREFLANGFSVSLVGNSADIPLLPELLGSVDIATLNTSSTARSIVPLSRFLRSRQTSILLSAYPLNNMAAVLARALARTPTKVVLTEHTPLEPCFPAYPALRRRVVRALLPAIYRRADAVIAVSESVKRTLRWTGVSDSRLHVLHNPALTMEPVRGSSEAAEHPWFSDTSIPIVLGVGRLHPDKDFPTLIRAFAQIRSRMHVRLVIAGDGPVLDALQSLTRELGISQDVLFTGYAPSPRLLMAKCNVFVLSSLNEGSPLVLVEALSAGCPVVGTATSGTMDVLENGRLGLLVPPANASALSDAIVTALSRPHDPQPGQDRATLFQADASARRYLALFDRLVRGHESAG